MTSDLRTVVKFTGKDGYQPKHQGLLEDYVEKQVKEGTFDYAANDTLLRLYSIAPDQANMKALALVLIKAMMQLPSPDLAHLLHLVPERLQEEQPLAAIIALTQQLESGRFQTFWLAVDSVRTDVAGVPGFYEAIRAYILHCLTTTCQKVSKQVLSESLRMEAGALDNLIQEKVAKEGWSTQQTPTGKTIIVFPKNDYNVIKPQAAPGAVFRLDQLTPLLNSVH
eukprot:jgi/Botrbrau1/638/Bobra.0161s0028.2